MSGPEFFQTGYGKRFYDSQLPDLITQLKRVADNVGTLASVQVAAATEFVRTKTFVVSIAHADLDGRVCAPSLNVKAFADLTEARAWLRETSGLLREEEGDSPNDVDARLEEMLHLDSSPTDDDDNALSWSIVTIG